MSESKSKSQQGEGSMGIFKNNEPQINANGRRLNIGDFCSERTAKSAKNAKGGAINGGS